MRSWSPLAIRVGWVNVDRSEGAERPNFWIAFSWVRKALMPIAWSRSSVRSSSRLTNAFAAALPVASRLKKRNSFGSDRVRVARRMSQYVTPTTLSMSLPPRGPVPVRTSLRTRSGCLTIRSWAIMPPIENEKTSILSNPSAADELVGVIGRFFDRVGNLSGRGTDAALVEGDDVSVLRDGVDDAGIPVVQGRGEVDEEDDGNAALGAEFSVGVGRAPDGDGARRGLGVRGDDGCRCAHDSSSFTDEIERCGCDSDVARSEHCVVDGGRGDRRRAPAARG